MRKKARICDKIKSIMNFARESLEDRECLADKSAEKFFDKSSKVKRFSDIPKKMNLLGAFCVWFLLYAHIWSLCFFAYGISNENIVERYGLQTDDITGFLYRLFELYYASDFEGARFLIIFILFDIVWRIKIIRNDFNAWALSLRKGVSFMTVSLASIISLGIFYQTTPFGYHDKTELMYALAGAVVILMILVIILNKMICFIQNKKGNKK